MRRSLHMKRYAVKLKHFVADHGGSEVACLEALFVAQCCIDILLWSAFCLNVFKQGNCHCATYRCVT